MTRRIAIRAPGARAAFTLAEVSIAAGILAIGMTMALLTFPVGANTVQIAERSLDGHLVALSFNSRYGAAADGNVLSRSASDFPDQQLRGVRADVLLPELDVGYKWAGNYIIALPVYGTGYEEGSKIELGSGSGQRGFKTEIGMYTKWESWASMAERGYTEGRVASMECWNDSPENRIQTITDYTDPLPPASPAVLPVEERSKPAKEAFCLAEIRILYRSTDPSGEQRQATMVVENIPAYGISNVATKTLWGTPAGRPAGFRGYLGK